MTARILDTWRSQRNDSSPDMESISETKTRIDWNLTHFHSQEMKNHRSVVPIILLLLFIRHNVRILDRSALAEDSLNDSIATATSN